MVLTQWTHGCAARASACATPEVETPSRHRLGEGQGQRTEGQKSEDRVTEGREREREALGVKGEA